MSVSIPKRISIAKYQQEKCDRITMDIPKGKRDAYKQIAAEMGLSLSMLVQNGVEGYARNYEGVVIPATANVAAEKISADERRLLDAAAKFPTDTRKLFLKLVEDLAAKLESKGDDDKTS